MKKLIAAFAVAAAVAVAAPAVAQPGGDARHQGGYGGGYGLNLNGLSVDQAKSELSRSGYKAYRSIRLDGRQYDLWSNARARNSCVGFSSYNGRVTDSRGFNGSDCGLAGGGGWGERFDANDLRGLRVDDAKRNLRDYGYTNTRNVRIDGQQWDLWADNRGRNCIGFTSYRGQVTNARDFRGSECDVNGRPGGGRWFDADDLRGLSVDSAKRELANAGFRGARSTRINGQQWDLWYDDSGRNNRCVGFTSYNGRVTNADEFNARDCR